MMKPKTTIKDKGFNRITKAIKDIQKNQPSVTIGVHENSGSYPSEEVTVAEVAFWNEYGTRFAPERSFIRSTVDENRKKYEALVKEYWQDVIAGKITTSKALEKIGFRIAVEIQNKIKNLWVPPNAESTTAKKTFGRSQNPNKYRISKPLIDSGLLLRSIGFQVFNEVKSEVIKNPGGN